MPKQEVADPEEEETFALDEGNDVPIYGPDGNVTMEYIALRKRWPDVLARLDRVVRGRKRASGGGARAKS